MELEGVWTWQWPARRRLVAYAVKRAEGEEPRASSQWKTPMFVLRQKHSLDSAILVRRNTCKRRNAPLTQTDFVRSPTHAPSQTVSPRTNTIMSTSTRDAELETEPLLQLFASKHPWVGGSVNASINSSMFVYNTTKHYSPRFVQYGANLVERNIATPVVNTVGTVGRYTGVEGGLRRYLDERRPRETRQRTYHPIDPVNHHLTGKSTAQQQ
jgi:hypothetical protein